MRRLGIVALFLALVGGFTAGVWRVAYVAALEPLARRGQADLSLAADRLTGELQRFKELAVLMAAHPAVGPVLEGRDPAEAQALLRSVADTTGLLDLAILAADGRELAAASDASGTTHAGTAHFERALDGALGSARALPDRYRRRVWWFAAPVFSEAGPVTGAALAVVDVEQVEADWRGDRPAVWFTGPDGVIFLSNRSELLFRARRGDPSRIVQGPDFAAGQVTAFVDFHPRPLAGFDLWDVDGGPYLPDRGLHLQADLPEIGMVAEVLLASRRRGSWRRCRRRRRPPSASRSGRSSSSRPSGGGRSPSPTSGSRGGWRSGRPSCRHWTRICAARWPSGWRPRRG
ncbi:cache domain-containing protein [Wenxinia marina]|uniref:Cache domain-containing protein n=1 Tax=Wenxinia marina DSM 24838 TaxID=1123501 RepID=A0A0D0QBA9_9RHOB|nr:hypothetical protein Wenmar_01936 [Wenxinia marina DSM 24838]